MNEARLLPELVEAYLQRAIQGTRTPRRVVVTQFGEMWQTSPVPHAGHVVFGP